MAKDATNLVVCERAKRGWAGCMHSDKAFGESLPTLRLLKVL